jgi:hypothetical protein
VKQGELVFFQDSFPSLRKGAQASAATAAGRYPQRWCELLN